MTIYGFLMMRLQDVLTLGPRQALWILLGATGVVLLIACVNVANLLLVRAVTRQKEMAVRTALGAGQGRLMRQVVTETVLLSIVGGLLGLALAAALLRLFQVIAPANFPRLGAVGLDARVLGFSITVAAAAGLLAAIIPALQAAKAEPNDALRATSRGATASGTRVSRLLVMGEIAMAVMLVAAAGLTIRSLQRLLQQDLGFTTRGVLTFTVSITDARRNDPPGLARFFASLEQRLGALPGVESAGAINMLPIAQTGTNGPVRLPDRVIKPEESPLAELRTATPGYYSTISVPLIAGRLPDRRDLPTGPPVAAITETLARQLWPGEPASAVVGRQIGTGFDLPNQWREVVGVIRDIRSRRPEAPPDAELHVPFAQFPLPSMAFTVRTTGAPESMIPTIRRELAQVDPTLPMASVRTFEEVVANATRNSRLYSMLTALFGMLAAALAIVGIYSVMSYTVAQRMRELAIRSALGASNNGLLQLVLREGFVLSAIGIAVGLAGAVGASRLIRALLYQVSPTDPLVFAMTAAGLAVAAVLGYVIPAFRASRVDAAVALRAE